MKHLLFVSATLFLLVEAFSGQAIAQTALTDSLSEPRTLFNGRQVGIYMAPEFQYGQLDGGFTPIANYSLIVLFNRRFAIGVSGGMSAVTDFDAAQAMQMKTGFIGLKTEYTFAPFRAVHLTVPVLVDAQMMQINSVGSGTFSNDHNLCSGTATVSR